MKLEEQLIHRALELEAQAEEWHELRRLAAADPTIWKRLADGLQETGIVHRALEERLAAADRVELPRERTLRLANLGWLAAALLGAAWIAQAWSLREPPKEVGLAAPASTQVVSNAEPGDYAPDVVSELPSLMIDTVPAADGSGYEVLFLRRTIERVQVKEIYQMTEDEHGKPVPSPAHSSPVPELERM